jgi:hypothetical protein
MPLSQNINLLDEVMATRQKPKAAGESNALQMMQAVATQPQIASSQLGAAMATSIGQAEIEKTKQAVQAAAPKLEENITRQQMAVQEENSAREIAIRKLADKNANRINQLDIEAGKRVSEQKRQFALDSAGRKYMNQQMLDNFMVTSAKSEQDLQNYVSYSNHILQRKAQVLEAYAKKLEAVAMQGYYREKQDLDQKSLLAITNEAARLRKKQEETLAKMRQRGAIGGLMMSVGAAVMVTTGWTGVGIAAGGALMAGGAYYASQEEK